MHIVKKVIKRIFRILSKFKVAVAKFPSVRKVDQDIMYDDNFWSSLVLFESEGKWCNEKICLFAHFDRNNEVSDRIYYYLKALSDAGFDIIFVSTSSDMSESVREKLIDVVAKVIVRKNIGYDFGSWRTGYQYAGDISRYSSLVLANDSVIGPVNSLKDMLEAMSSSKFNVWGVTDNYEINYHAQSYFLCFDSTILKSDFLPEFMSEIKVHDNKQVVINEYEVGLSQLALSKGFSVGAYCMYDDVVEYIRSSADEYKSRISNGKINSTLWLCDVLLSEFKSPFVKVELLRDNPHSVDLSGCINYIKTRSDFPIDFIKDEVPLSRFDKMTSRINLEGVGLEIGPSHSPILPKCEGYNVEILDHASADELRRKYAQLGIHEDKLKNIEHVDYVWTGGALDELTKKTDYYDYIVASHVVEHTPDLISFLSQCEKMLKSGGILSLAVPDKRYCFDYLRSLTTTGDVMQAYYDKRVRHSPGTIFDHCSTVVFRNGCHTWGKDDQGQLAYVHTLQEAMELVDKSRTSEEYFDVHNWVFVPDSFRLIANDLNSTGFVNLSEEVFFDTENFEFYIQFAKDKKLPRIDRMSYALQALQSQK